jgi:hypothetical protein
MSTISGPVWQQTGMTKYSGLASGESGRSIDLLAHSTDSAHIAPTRMSGVSYNFRTWSSCQIIIVSSTGVDPTRHDDEGVRDEHEVVQPGEERAVLKHLVDEWDDVLLEQQVAPDADRRSAGVRLGHPGTLVRRPHQPGSGSAHAASRTAPPLDLSVDYVRVACRP